MHRSCTDRVPRRLRPALLGALAAVLAGVGPVPGRAGMAAAQEAGTPDGEAPGAEGAPRKIRDNLFLLEEAYNQEPGVIQHIQAFQFEPTSGFGWSYSFTDEWPAPTDLHQFSLTLPMSGTAEPGNFALGDVLLNYRVQALGQGGQGWLAIAPRLSVVFPSGDWRRGAGRGVVGIQLNLPISIDLGPWFTLHVNGGATFSPNALSPAGARATAIDASAGIALVWLPLDWFNVLVETAYLSTEEVLDGGGTARDDVLLVNPGVRFALDVPGGLQIVPGLSVPIETWPAGGRTGLLAYLSLEHPAW